MAGPARTSPRTSGGPVPRRGSPGSNPGDVLFELGRRESQGLKYERVLFLSDAVFAIALTLLALDLRLPDDLSGGAAEATLGRLLQIPGPAFAFSVGFFVLAAYWTGHREIFGGVKRMNGRLIWLNFGFLFWIVLQPFATSLLGGHDPTPTSVIAYATVQVATGCFQAVLWTYATTRPAIVRPHVDARFRRWVTVELLRVPMVGVVSIPIAVLAGPGPAMASWSLVIPVTLVIHRHYRDQVREIPDD